jgi:hypothetical protein
VLAYARATKWGKKLNSKEIMAPSFLEKNHSLIDKVVISSGSVSEILPQVLSCGIAREKVVIPPKAFLGKHPFKNKENRKIAAELVFEMVERFRSRGKIVAVGGTALGFARDGDFIPWDFDMDFFAPDFLQESLEEYLDKKNIQHKIVNGILLFNFDLAGDEVIPVGIKFLDVTRLVYEDYFGDHYWEWPMEMFVDCEEVMIASKKVFIPKPSSTYLAGVFGETWQKPNKEFNYFDYNGAGGRGQACNSK